MIKLKNIKKNFGEQEVFQNVNLEARPGDFVGIIGRTGCGKSTLLNIISGYEGYDAGSNLFDEKELGKFNSIETNFFRNKRIAFLFQSFNLIDELSVYENLKLSMNMNLFKRKTIHEYLDKVGMLEYKHKKIKNLSGGQKQRIALVRAIIKDFDVLICDEPTGNLDDTNAHLILELIKEVCKDKIVIMVTHKKSISNKYFNKVYAYNYEKLTFELVKDHENTRESKPKKAKYVMVSKLGAIVHSLKRLSMLKMYNVGILFLLSLFMLSFATSVTLSGDSYENLLLENEKKFNPMYELKGYPEHEIDLDQLLESEYIDYVSKSYQFYGPIQFSATDFDIVAHRFLDGTMELDITENGEDYIRVIPDGNGTMSDDAYYVEETYDNITIQTFDKETFPHQDILVGRLPENDYEVVIDVSILFKLLKDYGYTYSDYLNGADSVENLMRLASNKSIRFYRAYEPYQDEDRGLFVQRIESVKLQIVGLLDSKHLSSYIAAIYATDRSVELASEVLLGAENNDLIVYKSDASEEVHDKVVDLIGDKIILDRDRINNIESSYINVKTMSSFNYFMSILALVIFSIGFIILLIYTYSHYKHDIAIYRSLGYNNFYVTLVLLLNNVLLSVIAFFIAKYVNTNYIATYLGYDAELFAIADVQVVNALWVALGLLTLICITYVVRYSKKSINSIM